MSVIKIDRRQLTNEEINLLINDIEQFPDLTYISKRRFRSFKSPYIIQDNHKFIGLCVIYYLKDWVKIGPLVILKKYQGKGYGKVLTAEIIKAHSKNNIFVASSNYIVEKLLQRFGFARIASYFYLPKTIRLFLIKQLFEYLNIKLIKEALRKKLFLKRHQLKFFVRHNNQQCPKI